MNNTPSDNSTLTPMLDTDNSASINTDASFKNKFKSFLSKYGFLLLAGAIPAILILILYMARGHYPFGEGSVLILDLNGQYVYFYEALRGIIYGEESLLYSFSRALGGEFLGIYDYYIASPFAWLVAAFPQNKILEALLCIFVLKTGLSGFTMGFYLYRRSSGTPNKVAIVLFSVMYAMCSYAIVQQHNSMWIDAFLWLPILTYAIEELIKYGKFRLFVFTLAIILLSNFYIGYMVCIYTVAYCFYYYFAHNKNNENNPLGEKNHFIRSIVRAAGWALLAIGIAAIAILSARYALAFGKDDFSTPDWSITQKLNLFELFYKFLPSSYDTVRPEGLPFVYCGVLTIMLVPAYFLCKKFSTREKAASAIFILFFVLSFTISTLDLIWHGFQKPNWLNYRYSFMLCFFLITLAFKAFEKVEYLSLKSMMGIIAFIGLFILVIQQMGDKLTAENAKLVVAPWATVYLALACLFVYFLIICLRAKSETGRGKEVLTTALAFLVCIEIFLSAASDMQDFGDDVVWSSYTGYNNFLNTFRPITETVNENDDSFFRMEKTYHRKTNDSMALNMNGLSLSTSTLNRSTITFLQKMGYSSKSHWSKYFGGTPVNDSLLGVKYLISDYDWSEYYGEPIYTKDDFGYAEDFTPTGTYKVYKNPYALSLAYAVDGDYINFEMGDYDNPFERLNAMITAMLGEDETVQVFVPAKMNGKPVLENAKEEFVDASRTADLIDEMKYTAQNKSNKASLTYSYTVPTDTMLYYYNPTGYNREVALKVNKNESEIITGLKQLAFAGNETTRMIYLGKMTSEDMKLEISFNYTRKVGSNSYNFSTQDFYTRERDSYVYYIDTDTLASVYERLADGQLIIDKDYTDDHFTGTLTAENENQLVFTSIPYDEGWNVYVDGKKVDTYETADALVSFYVDGVGTHDIELKYMPSQILLGFICSSACALIFVAILAAYPFLCKRGILTKTRVIISGDELDVAETPEAIAEITEGDLGYKEPDVPSIEEQSAKETAGSVKKKKAQSENAKVVKDEKTQTKDNAQKADK